MVRCCASLNRASVMLRLSSGFSMLQKKVKRKKKKRTSQALPHMCSLVNVVHSCLALNPRINVSLPYKLTLTVEHTQVTLQKNWDVDVVTYESYNNNNNKKKNI